MWCEANQGMEADQDSWASASSHVSCWSRDDDSLSFESLSATSLQCGEQAHSLLTDGLQSLQQYNHPTLIRDVTVNHFNNWLYLLDDSGIVKWNHDSHRGCRVFQFPPYKHKLLTNIIYSDYYNVYFVLTMSGKVKVLNKDLSEVHILELPIEQSKVSCIAYNDQTHQLITGGLGGIKIFNYRQQQVNWKVIKPMAQYSLVVDKVSDYVKGVWVRRLTVSDTMDWLIGMSGCDVLIYTFTGTLLLHMKRLHQAHVTCCIFLPLPKYYITASEDASVKVWSECCAPITSFNAHLKEVTDMLVHPHCQWVILTCSLDGTIKQWNLLTLQMEHSLTSSTGGGRKMGIVNKSCFYIMSASSIELVQFSCVTQFWALSYCKMSEMSLVLRDDRVPQILARGVDGSVRLYSSDSTHLTTVLPPHHSASVMSVAYCDDTHTLCTLSSDNELWLYSTRFNPARRVAVVIGSDYLSVEPLLSSVPPTTIRLHHKYDIITISGCGSLLVLGMIDGRVIILESRKDNQLRRIGYLQAFISPVMLLKFDRLLNTLVCASNYGDDAIYVQLWDIINWNLLTTIQCDSNSMLVDCAMLEDCIMTGHSNGTISLFRLNDSSSLNSHNDSEKLEDRVTSVQSCHAYSLFATTHSSNVVRLWSDHFILQLEVSTSPSLYACCFLPGQAGLILSLHNHLYKLMLENVLPHNVLMLQKETMETVATSNDTNSVIIDDFTSSPDPLTQQQHLAVAVAMTTSQAATEQLDDNSISDNESVLSPAATETYQSPSVTPLPSVWLFPSLGQPSPTSSSADLSCDGSGVSLIVPVEEPVGNNSPNKEMNESVQDHVIGTPSTDDKTNDLLSVQSPFTDQNQGHSINTKVTKVTRQSIEISESSRNTIIKKSNSDEPKQLVIDKNKKKVSATDIEFKKMSIAPGTSVNSKAVAMECDSEMVTTLATSNVSKVHKQLKPRPFNKSYKHKSPITLSSDVQNGGPPSQSDLLSVTNISRPSSKGDKGSSKSDRSSSKGDKRSPKADRPSSKADRPSSKADRPSSKADRPSSKGDKRSSKVDRPSLKADRLLSKADRPSSQDVTMTTSQHSDKHIISVIVNKKSSPDRKSESPDHSVAAINSNSSTGLGWQLNAIERAKWKSCIQSKRHEDAQLRRLQKDCERRLVKSASHSKCFPTTNSKWQQYSIERPQSVNTCNLDDVLSSPVIQHNSYHEHKLHCSDYRLQLYEHEK